MKKDFMNQDISEGDFVIIAAGHNLSMYRIIKFTPKMVKLQMVNSKRTIYRYPDEMMKVDEQLVSYHIMVNSN